MKRRIAVICAALCIVMSGCGWMDGSYVSVTPHQEHLSAVQSESISASNYQQLRSALVKLVQAGTEHAVIHVAEYDQDLVESAMDAATKYICQLLPLGAYAVDELQYEFGSSGGQPAISVNISYIHGRSEIRKIQQVQDMDAAEGAIAEALKDCDEGIVLQVKQYNRLDLVQMVEDYSVENPNIVMEVPQVAVGIYPDSGTTRIVELKFTYQTSRESLRQMQTQVQRVFASAALYINQNDAAAQKFAQLYRFLMERFDYQLETSITPSYSLLSHGVGDSKTFATVYAAMCRQAGLECHVVSGTRSGEPWHWNLICDEEGVYFHVDLLQSNLNGQFMVQTDGQMQGYVWDYSAYPKAGLEEPEPVEPEPTEPEQEQ